MLPVDGFRRRSGKLWKDENISISGVFFNFNVHSIFILHDVRTFAVPKNTLKISRLVLCKILYNIYAFFFQTSQVESRARFDHGLPQRRLWPILRLPGKMMHRRRPNASQNTRGVGDLILPTLSSTTTALKKVDFGRFERVVDNLIVKNKTDVDTQQHLEKLRTDTIGDFTCNP